ncbi:MAG: hypothetical protein ACTSR8_05670 [Promethearchaeota archaeon]
MADNPNSLEDVKKEAVKFLYKAADSLKELTFANIMQRVGISFPDLKVLVEDLIIEGLLNAEIKGNKILFNITHAPPKPSEIKKLQVVLQQILEKLDDVKSDTELIKEYTFYIEQIMEKQEDLEDFMIKRLGTDFDVLKHAWADYKAGKIGKAGLIGQGIKLLGKKFIKKLLVSAI